MRLRRTAISTGAILMILPLLRRVAVLEVMDGMGYLWALVQFIEWGL